MARIDPDTLPVEVPHARVLLKRMRWYDGFVLALAMPAAIFYTVGYTIAAIGALAAMALFGISALMGTLQNWLFAEMASMFPTKSGGISLC